MSGNMTKSVSYESYLGRSWQACVN